MLPSRGNRPRLHSPYSARWLPLTLLLDGLDEMEETARSVCITVITIYHSEHLTPLVVCSRQSEYEASEIRQRLALQSAVIVQPLSVRTSKRWPTQARSALSGQGDLNADPGFGKLAGMTTPAAIAEWVQHRAEQLRQLLPWKRPNFPCASTYGNVLRTLDAQQVNEVLAQFLTRAQSARHRRAKTDP
jgi:hypothetical protein